MARSRVILGSMYIPDWRTCRPVAGGSVYIGIPNLDPTVLANRKTVYLIQENGTEVPIAPAAQPLVTSAGGVVTYLGSPVQVQTDDEYSITVLDNIGAQVYYFNSVEDLLEVSQPILQALTFYDNDPSSASNAYVVEPLVTPMPDVLLDGQLILFRPSDDNSGASTLNVIGDGGPIGPKPYVLPDKTNDVPAGYIRTTRDYMCRYDQALDVFIDVDLGLFANNPSIQVWNQYIDYNTTPSYVTGSDGNLYKSTTTSGPNLGGDVDPVGDTTGTWVLVPSSVDPSIMDFRLSGTSGTPVTTSDLNISTLYLTPYIGKRISLYNGSAWTTIESNEVSLALGTMTAEIGYDVFAYLSSGVLTLEKLAWSSSSARATALTTQDGILVKSGDATRRYIGSFLSYTTLITRDASQNRYLFNYYNRVNRSCGSPGWSGASWTYTTATWRPSNNVTPAINSTTGPQWFVGVVEDAVQINLNASSSNSSASIQRINAYGLNSTTTPTGGRAIYSGAGNVNSTGSVSGSHIPTLGWNYVMSLEYSEASGTTTWFGSSGEVSLLCNVLVKC